MTWPSYDIPNNEQPTEVGPFHVNQCNALGCQALDYPAIAWCVLSIQQPNNYYIDVFASDIRPTQGPEFGLTFAIPLGTIAGSNNALTCVSAGEATTLYGAVNIYDTTPLISAVQQSPPDNPNGPFYVTITGTNLGNQPGSVSICKTGSSPCTTSAADFTKVDYSAEQSYWTTWKIKVLVTPTSDAVGDFDLVVESSGSNGGSFLGALLLTNSSKSAPKAKAVVILPIKIFIIHGLGDSSLSMEPIASNLRNALNPAKFTVDSGFNFSTCDSIKEGAYQLASYVRSKIANGQRVAFVTHSMGGLMARSMLAEAYLTALLPKPIVVGLITLGTPHLGAPTWPLVDQLGKCGIQLQEMQSYLTCSDLFDAMASSHSPNGGREFRFGLRVAF